MSAILILSADPKSVSEIEDLVHRLGFRSRTVTTPAQATEWLSMHQFSALLVDSRYTDAVSLPLIQRGWKHNPLLMGGIFRLGEAILDEWTPRAAGMKVFHGQDALPKLNETLSNLPQESIDDTHFPVLVVEDLDAPREIVCAYLESLGFSQVDGATGVSQALEQLRKNPSHYACILTDINMPKQSGIDLIKEVRRDSELNLIPIIVLTAYATAGNLIESIKAGASGFLVKPPTKKALHREIERAKRIRFNRMNPRLCQPEEAHLLEKALQSSDLV